MRKEIGVKEEYTVREIYLIDSQYQIDPNHKRNHSIINLYCCKVLYLETIDIEKYIDKKQT